MSKLGWALRHAAWDVWEAKAALAKKMGAGVGAVVLALGFGLASWGAWDMVRFVERDGALNATRPLAYALSQSCDQELSGLPKAWRASAGPLEFLGGPGARQEVVFACRKEGSLGLIERREARGGSGEWVERMKAGGEGGLDARQKATLERLEGLDWEESRAAPSWRAWGEALGLEELSAASRGMASSTSAAENSSVLSWAARGVVGLPMGVFLALGWSGSWAIKLWALLALGVIGVAAGIIAAGSVSTAPGGEGWRDWAPAMIGALAAAVSASLGLAFAWAVEWGAPEMSVAAGLAWSKQGPWMETLGAGVMGAAWLAGLALGLGAVAFGALRARSALMGCRRSLSERANRLIESPEFQARAQRRELSALTRGGREHSEGMAGEADRKRSPRL